MRMDHFGYSGRLLRVNLESEKIIVESPDASYYRHYLGGRGIIIHTLLTELPPHADPLGPDNKLIFATGLLTGHRFMGTGKSAIGSKSPLTGAYGESIGGGMWGVELKRAGYDAVIVEGRAKNPVYIWIHNDKVEIRDAGEIWGSEVMEATAWLREVTGERGSSCVVIGPGGERQVSFAGIIADCNHAFGRCGIGAVMGSKNLKAMAVKGEKLPLAAEREKLTPLNLSLKAKSAHHPFRKHGTGCRMAKLEEVGNLPIRNHSGGRFPNVHKIDAVALMTQYGVGTEGCFNCPVRCKKKIKIDEGPWPVDSAYGGAEYETLASFGSNLLIDDLRAICKAHEMCNRFGIDSISTGATIAFAMECFEKGILTLKDTDGVPLHFGNAEAMLQMVEKIGLRRGIGDLLARGSKRAAETIGKGSIEFAMQVKGLEVPYHDPRYKQGIGLHYSVHATGASHASGVMDDMLPLLLEDWESINVSEMIPPSELSPRKVRMVYELGLWAELPNYLGYCIFLPWSVFEVREAVAAVTGWPVTTWKLMKAVERGVTLARIFNLREGFTRGDDRLPERFYSAPSDGPLKGVRVDPNALKEAQDLYFQMMGWDKRGVPTKGCLVALDLEWAVPFVEKIR